MQEESTPTVERFYENISKGELTIVECDECKSRFGTPRSICPRCLSKGVRFTPSKGIGSVVSYTVIHVAPPDFQEKSPYILCIVQLDEGPRIMAMLTGMKPEELKVGQRVKFDWEGEKLQSQPCWARFHFKPI